MQTVADSPTLTDESGVETAYLYTARPGSMLHPQLSQKVVKVVDMSKVVFIIRCP